jgi:hypothetical protein
MKLNFKKNMNTNEINDKVRLIIQTLQISNKDVALILSQNYSTIYRKIKNKKFTSKDLTKIINYNKSNQDFINQFIVDDFKIINYEKL